MTDPSRACGVWVESSLGIYMGEWIQKIASFHGWSKQPTSPKGSINPNYPESVNYYRLIEEAINYLNQEVAPENWFFGYGSQGDFGLWSKICESCESTGKVWVCYECYTEGSKPIVCCNIPNLSKECSECGGKSRDSDLWRLP